MLTDIRKRGAELRSRSAPLSPQPSQTLRSGFVGVATKSGAFVPGDVLNSFAGKQESQQIREHDFAGILGLVEPLYDPVSLARHMEANTYHARAVKTKAQDVAGQGWELAPLVDKPDEGQRTLIQDFFESLEDDITDTLTWAMSDRESVGWLSIEMVRKDKVPDGPVVFLRNIPSHTMRAHNDGKRFVQVRGTRKAWFNWRMITDF